MIQSTVVYSLATDVSNGIAQSQAVAAAGNLTLNGSLVSGGVAQLGAQRRVLAASSGADVGKTLTIYGTNQGGASISEVLTLASSPSTVYTTLDFLTVTRIAAGSAMAGNITVGTNTIGSSPWVVDNPFIDNWSLRVACAVVSGSATYSVEWTMDDPNRIGASYVPTVQGWTSAPYGATPPLTWEDTTLKDLTVNSYTGFGDGPIFAHRLIIKSGTGTVVMQSIQAGIRGE